MSYVLVRSIIPCAYCENRCIALNGKRNFTTWREVLVIFLLLDIKQHHVVVTVVLNFSCGYPAM